MGKTWKQYKNFSAPKYCPDFWGTRTLYVNGRLRVDYGSLSGSELFSGTLRFQSVFPRFLAGKMHMFGLCHFVRELCDTSTTRVFLSLHVSFQRTKRSCCYINYLEIRSVHLQFPIHLWDINKSRMQNSKIQSSKGIILLKSQAYHVFSFTKYKFDIPSSLHTMVPAICQV